MSASEEIALQAVEAENGNHTKYLEPLEENVTTSTNITRETSSGGTKGTTAPSWWKKIFTGLATLIAYAFLNVGISMIAPFYPIVALEYNVPVYYTGFVIGMAPMWVAVTSPLIGYFLPHLGLKFTQLAGLFLNGGSLILFGFVSMMPSAASFLAFSFILRIVGGIGIAMYGTASYTLLTQFFPTKKGTIVSMMELALILGYAAGPTIGGGLQEAGGFILPCAVVGGCIVALMVFLVVLMPSTECTSVKISWRLLLKLCSNIIFVVLGAMTASRFVSIAFWAGVVTIVLVVGTFCAYFAYFGQFLHVEFKLSVGIVGVAYLATTLTYGVGITVTGPITDKLKIPRYMIITGALVNSIGFELIGPAEFITTPQLWLSILGSVLLGVGGSLAVVPVYTDLYGIAKTLHEEEEEIASILSGILVGANSAGEALGPMIGGGLVYKVGYRKMTSIFGLVVLVCALVLAIATVIQKVWKLCRKFNRKNK